MNRRQLTTILHLLRYHAEYTRRMHGETLPERPGGIELTPTEMETWADELEAQWERTPLYASIKTGIGCDPDAVAEALPGHSETDWLDT